MQKIQYFGQPNVVLLTAGFIMESVILSRPDPTLMRWAPGLASRSN